MLNAKSASVVPFEERFTYTKKTRFSGPNTTMLRDYIHPEESIFNNKNFVEKELGRNKKIYIRRDKMVFDK
jgi:hypothetical protein